MINEKKKNFRNSDQPKQMSWAFNVGNQKDETLFLFVVTPHPLTQHSNLGHVQNRSE